MTPAPEILMDILMSSLLLLPSSEVLLYGGINAAGEFYDTAPSLTWLHVHPLDKRGRNSMCVILIECSCFVPSVMSFDRRYCQVSSPLSSPRPTDRPTNGPSNA